MSVAAVRKHLEQFELAERLTELSASSATVSLAAQALGVAEARIAKTLSFRRSDGGVLLVVTAGDTKIDNHLFKAQFGIKAKMLKAEEIVEEVGHTVGGVCPMALKSGVEVFLDRSMLRFDTIFPAGGSANSAVKLTPDELAKVSGGTWTEVCKLND